MDEKNRIPFVVGPTVARLYGEWDARSFLGTEVYGHVREPTGEFLRLDFLLRKSTNQGPRLHIYKWVTRLLSIHTNSDTLVRLAASMKWSHIFRGSLDIVVIPPPNSQQEGLDLTADGENVRTAVLHTRSNHVKYMTKNYCCWSERRFDDAVRDSVEWTVARLSVNDAPKPLHAHCEVESPTFTTTI
ncbi:hypothetical protein PM082_013669 [Marasmius tenuissimus]|nr:hypothetical protein PM082_013669 [Marasmius tenuissimus]